MPPGDAMVFVFICDNCRLDLTVYIPSSSLQSLSSCQALRQPKEKSFEIPSVQLEFGKIIVCSLAPSNFSWSLGFCLPVCLSPGGVYSWPPSQHPPLMSQDPFHACKFAAQLLEEWHEYCNSIWCQMAIQPHRDEAHPQGCPREEISKADCQQSLF